MNKSSVTHFEMGYEEPDRVQKFYQKAFGWETKNMGEQMGNYILATTAETDENQMIKEPGRINGGFFDLKLSPYKEPSVVVEVEDISAAMKAVTEAGGKVIGVPDQTGKITMEPQDIPGVGLWMSIQDTEGNRLSMIQPKREQGG